MELFEELRALGVDIDDGLKRVMGNEKLYKRLLGSFVKMTDTNTIRPDFDTSDYTKETEKAHSIKGTAANLSITPISEAYTRILGLLRTGKPEEAREVLGEVLPIQGEIIRCIESHME